MYYKIRPNRQSSVRAKNVDLNAGAVSIGVLEVKTRVDGRLYGSGPCLHIAAALSHKHTCSSTKEAEVKLTWRACYMASVAMTVFRCGTFLDHKPTSPIDHYQDSFINEAISRTATGNT